MKNIFRVLTMNGYMIEDKMISQWVISSNDKWKKENKFIFWNFEIWFLPLNGAYTFKYKQSSLWFFSCGTICLRALNLPFPMFCKAADSFLIWGGCWGQTGPNSTACLTFLHFVAVTGGINLSDCIGGAAKGIPRNTSTCLL